MVIQGYLQVEITSRLVRFADQSEDSLRGILSPRQESHGRMRFSLGSFDSFVHLFVRSFVRSVDAACFFILYRLLQLIR